MVRNRLQIHRLDRGAPKKEIMRALNDVVDKGWVRYIGASSMAAWEFQELQVRSISCFRKKEDYLLTQPLCKNRTSQNPTTGTNSSACKTTTTSSTAKKSAK